MVNTGSPQTFGGVISGSGALTQMGPGTLTLNAANTYSGPTTLSGGVLSLGSSESAGTSGPMGNPATPANSIVLGGGTLQYTSANQYDYSSRFSTAPASSTTLTSTARTSPGRESDQFRRVPLAQ